MNQLNRSQRRAAGKHLKKTAKSYSAELEEIPREQWPVPAPEILRVWRSARFLVQEYAPAQRTAHMVECRLSILRTALSGKDWEDRIGWDELQAVKTQCGYAELDAVEVYPRAADVINVAALRHIWILKGLLPFAWRRTNGMN